MGILQIISDVLSVVTIAMSLFLKVPQIKTVHALKSAKGLNVCSLILELSSYTTTACYNYVNGYSILSYLEYPIIIFQEYILIYLVFHYEGLISKKTVGIFAAYFLIAWGFTSGLIPAEVLMYLVPLCTPVSLSSKAIQLWEILSTQNADSVSVSTWIISAATNCSRLYTVYLDSADMILLSNFGLSTIMSSLIAASAYSLQKKSKSKVQ